MKVEEKITKEPIYEKVLKGYEEKKTQIYVANDGTKFFSEGRCKEYEEEQELKSFSTYCNQHKDELDKKFSNKTIELNDEEVDAFDCERFAVWIESKIELRKYIFNTHRIGSDKYRQIIYENAIRDIQLDFPCWVAQANLEYATEYISLSERVENLQEALKSFKEKEEKVGKDNDRS